MKNNEKNNKKLPPYVAYYGLAREPFGQDIEDDLFYEEPSRKQRLGTMLHLTQFGNELMIITGPKGSGKTTLLQQFKKVSPDPWRIAHIEAKNGIDERKLLQQVFRQMGLDFRGATHQELLEKMTVQFDLSQRKGRYCVMVIDDADMLPVTAMKKVLEMASLISTVNKPLLRVLLFGTETILETLKDPLLIEYTELPKRAMDLPAFHDDDTSHYILSRLSAADFTVEKIFTPSAMMKIHNESYGWPSRINELSHNILMKSLPKNMQQTKPDSGPKAFNSSRSISLGLITALIVVIFIFRNDVLNLVNQFATAGNQSADSTASAKINPAQKKEPETTTKQPAKKAMTLVEKLKQQNPAYRPANEKSKTENPVNLKPVDPKPVAAKPKTINPVAQKKAAPAKASITAKASSTPLASVDIATIPRKESWILSQNSNHYTLQIVAGENLKTIEKFIAKHELFNNIAFYRSVRNGKPWYGLIYGIYSHKQAAVSAVDQLPERIKRLKPWVRKIQSVQQDIYKTKPTG